MRIWVHLPPFAVELLPVGAVNYEFRRLTAIAVTHAASLIAVLLMLRTSSILDAECFLELHI